MATDGILSTIQSKPCTKCGETLPAETGRGRPRSLCAPCAVASQRAANRRYKERQRALRGPAPPRPRKYATEAEQRKAAKRRSDLRRRGLPVDTPRHTGVCSTCERQLTLNDFPYHEERRLGRMSTCFDCRPDKCCSRCGESKPLAEFASHAGKRDGLMSYCKPCARVRVNQWVAANPGKVAAQRARKKAENRIRHRGGKVDVAEKRCRKCDTTKPAGRFHRNGDTADGLSRWCKVCRNGWVAENPGRMREYARKRHALVAATRVENVDRFVVYEREGGRCHICGRRVRRDRFHLEHLYPIAAGGEHSYANVAIAHAACNRRKHDHVVDVQLRLA